MKIIIVGQDRARIRRIVEYHGSAVVAEAENLESLVSLLLKHTPHLVLITGCKNAEIMLPDLGNTFVAIRFIVLGQGRNQNIDEAVTKALQHGHIGVPWRPEKPDARKVIIDAEYAPFLCFQKLKRPIKTGDWKSDADSQVLRLTWMLRTARVQRQRANVYRSAFIEIGGYEWQEIAYRTVHGSFKSPVYARQQVARYLGYLAHFVPSVDLDGLPSPIDEPAHLKYVHHGATLEMHYTLFCLGLFGFESGLSTQIHEACDWCFRGQSEEELSRTSINFTGLAFEALIIDYAQGTVIDWLLDPDALRHLDSFRPRDLHRSIQTFTDFWNLRHVMDDLRLLAGVIKDFQNNPKQAVPDELAIPSFSQFHRAITAQTKTKK